MTCPEQLRPALRPMQLAKKIGETQLLPDDEKMPVQLG
jgi:hypothetical protein